ncbi:lasso peptide biosynthesis B2 protein [Paenactinomyces guangxiensis]|uniref:Lasso peptide biosynthesis B2 protein n=1 Tax=Paenactinomyces guangxiensis TaxID=1490290 RepID=A0A7W1WPS3_9BACL|nr:lasso peptide biosynthesis B2 protein [Paenactinomyces guangxiensis]MBA4493679.1 lasso peptide biosynthesis B2 protein [Paenactinomyces guangxiensis]MBH8590966.1 lasso peptide biosynthesis B2 protein [Paenactinomyces guangxiensis]
MGKNMMFNEPTSTISLNKPIKTLFCLLISWTIVRCLSMENIQILLKYMKKQKYLSPMTFDEAMIVYQSIHQMKRWAWVRLACLETSLALLMYAYFEGKSVDFCVGVKLYPFESHAWVEVNGLPVQEDESTEKYKKIMMI